MGCYTFSPKATPDSIRSCPRSLFSHAGDNAKVFSSILCDNHFHTRFWRHVSGEREEYVQSAIQKGLEPITFPEHMEEGILCQTDTWLSEQEFDSYFAERRRLQGLYGEHLGIDRQTSPVILVT